MIIALTGFMASGKTSFGGAAARRLGWKFLDLDHIIESRYGRIPQIFEEHGETFFRDIETRMLREVVSSKDNIILALGGGTILREENREVMKGSATVIWLNTAFSIILSELKNTDRPLVKEKTPQQIEQLYESRIAIYRQAADIVVDINDFDYNKAIRSLIQAIEKAKDSK